LENARNGNEDRELYEYFLKAQKEALSEVREILMPRVTEAAGTDSGVSAERIARRKSLTLTALNLAIDARVRVMMAQKIIDMLGKEE